MATGTNHTVSAPFNLTEVDRLLLSQTDEEFIPHSWNELKEIVAANDLSVFRRKPSQLAKYIDWSRKVKEEYGTITNYICQERLHWDSLPPSGLKEESSSLPRSAFEVRNPIPFADQADYKILRNDWPYGTASGIAHLVVWMKTPIAVDPADGILLPEGRAQIQEFVNQTFVKRLEREGGAEDKVLWFKNWTALQSVGALEHFHVMLRNVDESALLDWTGEGERNQAA